MTGPLTAASTRPPEVALFEQVLAYLESLPKPANYQGLSIGREAVAATAVCLRWGSYLAVLADRDKPLRGAGADQHDLLPAGHGLLAAFELIYSPSISWKENGCRWRYRWPDGPRNDL